MDFSFEKDIDDYHLDISVLENRRNKIFVDCGINTTHSTISKNYNTDLDTSNKKLNLINLNLKDNKSIKIKDLEINTDFYSTRTSLNFYSKTLKAPNSTRLLKKNNSKSVIKDLAIKRFNAFKEKQAKNQFFTPKNNVLKKTKNDEEEFKIKFFSPTKQLNLDKFKNTILNRKQHKIK